MKKILREVLNWGNNTVVEKTKKYPKEVIEIHNSFNLESEKLLKEAQSMLNDLSIKDITKNKAELAKSLGFKNIFEVKEFEEYSSKVKDTEKVLNAVVESIEYIPNAKWIPLSSVERICKQWGLVFGDSSQYKGFLPVKNLQEIQEFKNNHNDKFDCLLHSFWRGETTFNFNKYTISEFKELHGESLDHFDESSSVFNTLNSLKICAPLKDMELTWRDEVVDGWKVQNITDPIVLARRDFKGIEGYFIITAWGDESNDDEVIGY